MANEAPNQNSIFRTIYDRVWVAIRVGMMGWDGTGGRKVKVDTDGQVYVRLDQAITIGTVDQGSPNAGGANAWPVQVEKILGSVDAGNSSTTPLGSLATFTGTFKDVKDYAGVGLFVQADQISATGGLKVEWSIDGVTVHGEESLTYDTPGSFRALPLIRKAQYMRAKYINGLTAQGSFRLQTILSAQPLTQRLASIVSVLSDSDQVQIVRAVIGGKSTVGYVNALIDDGGRFFVRGIPERYTSLIGRSKKQLTTGSITASTTLYTVTAGKKLYVTGYVVTMRNSDTNSGGVIRIRDSTTTIHEFTIGPAVLGAVLPAHSTAFPCELNPLEFSTNFNVQIVIGNIVCSVSINGYEE